MSDRRPAENGPNPKRVPRVSRGGVLVSVSVSQLLRLRETSKRRVPVGPEAPCFSISKG